MFLKALQDFIDKRHEEMPQGSYTTSLFESGINKIAQKVGEEACRNSDRSYEWNKRTSDL